MCFDAAKRSLFLSLNRILEYFLGNRHKCEISTPLVRVVEILICFIKIHRDNQYTKNNSRYLLRSRRKGPGYELQIRLEDFTEMDENDCFENAFIAKSKWSGETCDLGVWRMDICEEVDGFIECQFSTIRRFLATVTDFKSQEKHLPYFQKLYFKLFT